MEQHTELILEDFRTSKKEINRLFFVGIFFALAVHIYVIEPYFELKIKERDLQESLVELKKEMAFLSSQSKKVKSVNHSANTTLDKIRNQIDIFPDELRNKLTLIDRELSARRSQTTSGSFNQNNIRQQTQNSSNHQSLTALNIPNDITKFGDGVTWYINDWFNQLLEQLENKVVNPIVDLSSVTGNRDSNELSQITNKAIEKVRMYIDGIPPDFWHTYGGSGGKIDVAKGLRKNINAAFKPVDDMVSKLLEETSRLIDVKKDKTNKKEVELEKNKDNMKVLANRLTSLESPLGRIPLGLTNLIKLFPMLIIVLVVKFTYTLTQSVKLKNLLKQPLKDSNLPPELFSYQMGGLFFSASHNKRSTTFIIIWLAILAIIYTRASLLIANSPSLFTTINGEILTTRQQCFQGAYLFGLLVLIISSYMTIRKKFEDSSK